MHVYVDRESGRPAPLPEKLRSALVYLRPIQGGEPGEAPEHTDRTALRGLSDASMTTSRHRNDEVGFP